MAVQTIIAKPVVLCGCLALVLGSALAKGEGLVVPHHYIAIEETLAQCDESQRHTALKAWGGVAGMMVGASATGAGLGAGVGAAAAAVDNKILGVGAGKFALAGALVLFLSAAALVSAAIPHSSCLEKMHKVTITGDTIVFWNSEKQRGLRCLVEYGPDFYFPNSYTLSTAEDFHKLNSVLQIKYDTCGWVKGVHGF